LGFAQKSQPLQAAGFCATFPLRVGNFYLFQAKPEKLIELARYDFSLNINHSELRGLQPQAAKLSSRILG